MSFARLLKKFGQTSLAHPRLTTSPDAGSSSANESSKSHQHRQVSEPMLTIARPWRKKRSSALDRSGVARPTSTSSATPDTIDSTSLHGEREISLQMPVPTNPIVSITTDLTTIDPPPENINQVRDKLTEAWEAVRNDPKTTDASRVCDAVDNIAAKTQNYVARSIPVVKATVAAVQQTDIGKAMKEGINKFSESMPIFMKALDEVKSLHPFIGVVVLAFQTVYTLEQKRHDNDKKITSLFVGMRDMMGALFLLKNMENDKLVAPDGISIEDRLRSLVDRTADDIKMCSNVCDAYMKKRVLAKVLMSSVWDGKLLDFVKLFATRRQEFEFELTMHTSQGVDKANLKLDAIGEATRALNEQMNAIKTVFEQLANPEQKRLSELVVAKGGVKALKEDDRVLLELERTAGRASGAPKGDLGRTRWDRSMDASSSADDLRRDIFEDPNVAVENNLIIFSRKFEAQKNQIIHELALVVKRESDRVIREVKGGPHERILDRSVYEIWTEMAWRGNVKARHFVLALRDYYLEKLASGAENILGMGTAAGVYLPHDPDAWAIKYIDVMRLQPIKEAIDDDASGFITIGEINRFTASRPIDWSLPHWVAFWAVGYKASIIDYAHKIEELFTKMDRIRAEVLPLNQHAIITYFAYVWASVHSLIAPLLSLQPGKDEPEKFKSYLESEEARLENNLTAVDYIIDGTDTLTLITGVGRIEKTVFPLVYLMMKRHYGIMQIMRTRVLDLREVLEIANSMYNIQEAINYRVDDLTNNFIQQKLDVDKQFQTFAYGIFTYFKDPTAVWSRDHMLGLDHQTTLYDNLDEDQSVKIENVLRFESSDETSLDYWVYDGHSIDDIPDYGNVKPPLHDILGHWHGYFYEREGVRETVGTDSMMTLILVPAEGEQNFKANGWSIRGRFTVTGSWSIDKNGVMQIKFKMSFPFRIRHVVPIFFNGNFDLTHNALTGIWGYSAELENTTGLLELRRIPPRYLAVYPCIKELSENRSRALWRFAIAAVRYDIRQRWCPWSFFAQRRDDRKTVVSLAIRSQLFGKPLDDEEAERLCIAVQRLTPADACFYGSMIYRQRASTLTHENLLCDACGGRIGGARLICLDCIDQSNTFYTIDLCCAPDSRCIDERVTCREDLAGPHEPFHKLIKLRTAVPTHRLGRTYNLACAAFERVEDFLAKIARTSQHSQEQKESERPAIILVEEGGSQNGTEIGPTIIEMLSSSDRSDGTSTDVGNTRGSVEGKPTVTEVSEKNNSAFSTTDDVNGQNEAEHNVSQVSTHAQHQDKSLPTCGECNKHLSFPLWYCIYCEDNLFICDECDARGVPELMRSSGRHTEEHHLVRCLKPKTDDGVVSPPEQRLFSIEGRLADMQTQFADMRMQFADIQTQSKTQFDDLAARIGNIEELLRQLAGSSRSG